MLDNEDINTLSRPVDPRALVFTPLGLGGPMQPQVAETFLTRECELLALPVAVPEAVRAQFAKVLRLYSDGLFAYDHFTTASREAHRVLEVALKVRFLEHYADGVPLVTEGAERRVRVSTVEELRQVLSQEARLKGYPRFKGSLASLLSWARDEGYLYGQRNRVREWATRKIRNEEMHTEFDSIYMPPDTVRTLRLVSEMIARLWGADMPSRMAYPGTIDRLPMVVGHGPLGLEGTQFALEQLAEVRDDQAEERIWFVVLSAWHEELISWAPDIETTSSPVTRLWGPGSWQDLHEAVCAPGSTWQADTVKAVDRIFYMRVCAGAVDYARSGEQVRALRGSAPDERWFVVTADTPGDARNHVHRVVTGSCKSRHCHCPVTPIYEGARLETVVRYAKEHPAA